MIFGEKPYEEEPDSYNEYKRAYDQVYDDYYDKAIRAGIVDADANAHSRAEDARWNFLFNRFDGMARHGVFVSHEVKELIFNMLAFNPELRISVKDAIDDIWFTHAAVIDEELKKKSKTFRFREHRRRHDFREHPGKSGQFMGVEFGSSDLH